MSLLRWLLVGMIAAALAGCGARAVLGPAVQVPGVEPEAIVPVYVATTRVRTSDIGLPYSSARSNSLNFSSLEIALPENHRTGNVATSSRAPDPRRHFFALSHQAIRDSERFIDQLNSALADRPPASREILIFVHGYNNNFADGIFRNAQIVHDYGIKAVALHYAWPSGAAVPLYVFDRDSALVGRRGLAETIEIAARTKANRIILLGHSMGAYVVTEALRDLALQGRTDILRRLGGVVLAAPDIDVDVFFSQLDDIRDIPRPFTIVVSRRDRALGFSRRLAGGKPRVGSGADVDLLQQRDIGVIDVSEIDGGTHGVFASSPTLMDVVNNDALLRNVLREPVSVGQSTLVEGAMVAEVAASVVVFLPSRLLGAMAQAGPR